MSNEWKYGESDTQWRILVVGVYLAGHANTASHIVQELARSHLHQVVQRWVSIGGTAPCGEMQDVTVASTRKMIPKFELINELLAQEELHEYDYVMVCDDDITLPWDFLDRLLALQTRFDFALAQPARAHGSYLDHPIVEQVDGLSARRTRFVEIGPLFCMRRDIVPLLVPFDIRAPMGWGLDFIWPLIAEKSNLRMGIIDAVPVNHGIRRPTENYDARRVRKEMKSYLRGRDRLSRRQAFRVLEEYR